MNEASARALAAAEHAPGTMREALAGAVEGAGVIERTDDPAQAHAAAEAARAARVLDQAVALDQQRIFRLDRLDRQARGVCDVHLHAVLAVVRRAPAEAAA